ncbi:MAG: pyridoxal-phosphate dependent enzyme [Clostridia bacterium]|nr:pyridoxal-phosphate dependent enzyme [Clostridia bacterium]
MDLPQKNSLFKPTIIEQISSLGDNCIFVKRDDLLPFSFGGNKARKAVYFFDEILRGGYDSVVTYGSSSSNHCRVIANMACKYGLICYIVSPEEEYTETFNSILVKSFGAKIVKAPLDEISQTIDALMNDLSKISKPYFIQGGGHGNLGTKAYVDAYNEICDWEKENHIYFDYIFHASGTGTTQAGLVCGAVLKGDNKRQIVGISIARPNPRGKQVVEQSVQDYLESVNYDGEVPNIIFDDSYICGGYGKHTPEIKETIHQMLCQNGIPLNATYTGKAFWGMTEFIKKNNIKNKNILFVHTGGSPLFFNDIKEKFL